MRLRLTVTSRGRATGPDNGPVGHYARCPHVLEAWVADVPETKRRARGANVSDLVRRYAPDEEVPCLECEGSK